MLSAMRFMMAAAFSRSEEHTSELQSRPHLVCRLLLEKKTHPFATDTYLKAVSGLSYAYCNQDKPLEASSDVRLATIQVTTTTTSKRFTLFFLITGPPPRSTLFPPSPPFR